MLLSLSLSKMLYIPHSINNDFSGYVYTGNAYKIYNMDMTKHE